MEIKMRSEKDIKNKLKEEFLQEMNFEELLKICIHYFYEMLKYFNLVRKNLDNTNHFFNKSERLNTSIHQLEQILQHTEKINENLKIAEQRIERMINRLSNIRI